MPRHIEPNKTCVSALPFPPHHKQSPLATLNYVVPQSLALRDGEVVIFRRSASPLWQCRFKRHDGTWERVSTKQASIEHAVRVACDHYDESRFRQRLGLAQKSPTFVQIAQASLYEMRRDLDAGIGKSLMSTSRSTQVLDMFARFTDDAKTDPTVFRMFTKGVPLDPKAGFIEKEEEVLLAPNSEHRILFKGQRPAFDSNGKFLKDVTEIVTEQIGVDPHQGHSESNQWIIDAVLKGFDDLENRTRTRNPADPRLVKDDGDI